MKKIITAALAAAIILSLAGCSSGDEPSQVLPPKKTSSESKAAEENNKDDDTTNAEDSNTTDGESSDGTVVTAHIGDFLLDVDTAQWEAIGQDGIGYKLTYMLSEEDIEKYSYQFVITIENGPDFQEIKSAVMGLYNGNGVFDDPTEEDINGQTFTRVAGELVGDGSADMADLNLLFCQPEEDGDILVIRYTSVSMDGDPYEPAEQGIDDLLASLRYEKTE